MAMGSTTIKGQIVIDYLKQWPDLPNMTLARKIYNENKEAFKSADSVRSFIRYQKGSNGTDNRKRIKDKRNMTQENIEKFIDESIDLPITEAEQFEPYILATATKRILLLSDTHLPYHNSEGIKQALIYGKEKQVDTIILNGDIMDCYMLSRFVKDPRRRNIKYELEVMQTFLKSLRESFPNTVIIWKFGNHEERWETYLKIKAPELLDVAEFNLDILLRCGELGIEVVKDKRIIKIGRLNILHGHEIMRGAATPVNPARTFFLRAKANIIGGHCHRSSEHIEKDLDESVTGAWSVGALCDLHPEYAPINNWNLGYAYIRISGDRFWVDNRKII